MPFQFNISIISYGNPIDSQFSFLVIANSLCFNFVPYRNFLLVFGNVLLSLFLFLHSCCCHLCFMCQSTSKPTSNGRLTVKTFHFNFKCKSERNCEILYYNIISFVINKGSGHPKYKESINVYFMEFESGNYFYTFDENIYSKQ